MHVAVIFHRVCASLEAPMGWCSSNAVDLYLEVLGSGLVQDSGNPD
jgi:hypothetical protein